MEAPPVRDSGQGSTWLTGWRFWALCAVAVALAAALRAPALGTDLWLDEVWSLDFAKRAGSVWEIVFGEDFRHDNNHHLNTVFLWLLGEGRAGPTYRSLAFLSGLVAVPAAMFSSRRRAPLAGVFAGLLFASSFILAVYSTEARGHGPAVCFTLLALVCLERFLERRTARWAISFSACMVLAFTAQLASMHFYLGALLWSGVRLLRGEGSVRRRLASLAWLHVVPLGYLIVLYVTVLRSLRIGGGDPWRWQQVVDEALAWTLGYPIATVPALVAAAAVVALLGWDLRRVARAGDDVWILDLSVIVLAPALTLTLLGPTVLYARYFLLPLTFLLLVVARALARVAELRGGMLPALAALALFGVGNGAHLLRFWEFGRGGYRQALSDIAAASTEERIEIGVDHEFRTRLPVFYHKRSLPAGRKLRTFTVDGLRQGERPGGVEWFILHSQEYDPEVVENPFFPPGVAYRLFGRYAYYGPSGMHWFVYRRD